VVGTTRCLPKSCGLAKIVSTFRLAQQKAFGWHNKAFGLRKEKGGLLLAATRGLPFLAVSNASFPALEDPQP